MTLIEFVETKETVLAGGRVERTQLATPSSPNQRYCLTGKGQPWR